MKKNFYSIIILLSLLLQNSHAVYAAPANYQDSSEPEEGRVYNLAIPGLVNGTLCYTPGNSLELTFDTEGDFPEDATLHAELVNPTAGWYRRIGSVLARTSNEISLTMPDELLVTSGKYQLWVTYNDTRIPGGRNIDSDTLELEIIMPVQLDVEMSPSGEVQANSEDNVYFTIQSGKNEGTFYKVMSDRTDADITDWMRIDNQPLTFLLTELQPGTYYILARGANENQTVICQDSVLTSAYFEVVPVDGRVTSLGIFGHPNNKICYTPGDELALDIATQGNFPTGATLHVELVSPSAGWYRRIGSVLAGTSNEISLTMPDELLVTSGKYQLWVTYHDARIPGGRNIDSDTLELEIIMPVSQEVNINLTGIVEVDESEEIELIIKSENNNEGTWYQLVHVGLGQIVKDWMQIDNQDLKLVFSSIGEGSYRLFAKASTADMTITCGDTIATNGYFNIKHKDHHPGGNLFVSDENGIKIIPDENNIYKVCAGDIISIYLGDKNATYKWYRNNVWLDNINPNAFGIGVFLDQAGRHGTGEYKVEIFPVGGEGSYFSETVKVEFIPLPEPELIVEGNLNLCTDEYVYLTGPEGYDYYFWYTNGTLIEQQNSNRLRATLAGTYYLEVQNENGCLSKPSGQKTVVVNPKPTPRTARPDSDLLCQAGEGQIIIENSSLNVSYYLRDRVYSNTISGPVAGTGGNINLSTGNLTQTSYFSVFAISDGSGCSREFGNIIIRVENSGFILTSEGGILIAPEAVSYQWYRNGQQLAGEVFKTLQPETAGTYLVKIITENGCTLTSAEYRHGITGIAGSKDHSISIYPNPAMDRVYVKDNSGYYGTVGIKISGMEGIEYINVEKHSSSTELEITLDNLKSGIYFMTISRGEQSIVQKLVKQ